MATHIGRESQLVDMLIHLVELDFDAISAYEAAIDRLSDPIAKQKMEEFLLDHRRHTQELSPIIEELGGRPPTGGDFKVVVTTGKVLVGHMAGDDGILRAMRSNEDDATRAYEQASARPLIDAELRAILVRGLGDERRHRAWFNSALGSSRSSAHSTPPSAGLRPSY